MPFFSPFVSWQPSFVKINYYLSSLIGFCIISWFFYLSILLRPCFMPSFAMCVWGCVGVVLRWAHAPHDGRTKMLPEHIVVLPGHVPFPFMMIYPLNHIVYIYTIGAFSWGFYAQRILLFLIGGSFKASTWNDLELYVVIFIKIRNIWSSIRQL